MPKQQRKIKFSEVLTALLDTNKPFPPMYLHQFSDLSAQDFATLKKSWPTIKVERRQSLMTDLEALMEADTTVAFEDMSRLALKDSDPQVRSTAVRLLWDTPQRSLVPILIGILNNDPDFSVRAAAATALGLYISLGELEELDSSLLNTIEEALLAAVAGSDDKLVRRRALESLGFSSRPEVTQLIQTAYDSGEKDWIESALFAIGRTADPIWSEAVMKMFDSPIEAVQMEAITAAGQLELSEARQPLLDILETASGSEIHDTAIWSLSCIGGEGVRDILEAMLEEIDDDDEESFLNEALENLDFHEEMSVLDLLDVDLEHEEARVIDLSELQEEDEEEIIELKPEKKGKKNK